MGKLNILKTIEKQKEKGINKRYTVCPIDIITVENDSNGWFMFGCNMFYLGYAQGQKALLAEQKKQGV